MQQLLGNLSHLTHLYFMIFYDLEFLFILLRIRLERRKY